MTDTKYTKLTNASNEEATELIHLQNIEEEIGLNLDDEVQVQRNLTDNQNKRLKSTNMLHLAFKHLILITIYLSLSICLTFYQKSILRKIEFPLSIVLYHLIMKFLFSLFIRIIYKLVTGRNRVLLDWKSSLKKMATTGMASGIDIGFSNWGLELVQISLYTMTKSTTIIFILFFAILLKLEKKSWSLIMIVIMISSGLFLFTYKSTQFDAIGFAFLLFASFSSGIRWSFAQLIMQKSKLGLHNPVDMIFHMQPWMMVSLLPIAIGFEGQRIAVIIGSISNYSSDDILLIFSKITFGAVIAFVMEISEFLVLSHTSSLTLSIAGIFKEICQLVLAVELNGDVLSFLNILGLILCLGGICCHIIHKYSVFMYPKHDNIFDVQNTSHLNDSNDDKTSMTFHKNLLLKNNNGQSTIPLLDSNNDINSDTDSDSKNNQNDAEDVIFDILKRRDQRR